MRKLWIVVANSSFAQFYEVQGPAKNLREVHLIDFPDGRKKSSEVYSNPPTRTFDSMNGSRHAVLAEVDYHSHVQGVLCRQICDYLKKGLEGRHFDELAIIAPTEFMGVMHKELPEAVKKTVYKEVKKDLPMTLNAHERLQTIIKYLDLP